MDLRWACRISAKTCFKVRSDKNIQRINHSKYSWFLFFLSWVGFCLRCVCACVYVSFFSLKQKESKISQLVEIIYRNGEPGTQSNFILTQRQQHVENIYSNRDIYSQSLIILDMKWKLFSWNKVSLQVKWWE